MIIRQREYSDTTGHIMGILNVTPDSFSDGGSFNDIDRALRHVEQMINDGADIIDIGGESTRPGYEHISIDEEIHRVVPIIEAIHNRFDVYISLDTYHSQVAVSGIESGADMINDIWGLQYDNGEMAEVISKSGTACCLMHNRKETDYTDYIDDVKNDLLKTIEIAKSAGIEKNRICLDPGIGFAKSFEQNLELLKHMEVICNIGYPVLLGTSRKSVIGLALDLPVTERMEGTVATTVAGYLAGCRIFRVHDVKENRRALTMIEQISLAD